MSAEKANPVSTFQKRVNAEIQDNLDEDIELELEDSDLADLLAETEHLPMHDTLPRQVYFRELFRLQAELVKLQDWVIASGEKVLILFEGRDAAGKGGAIKRVTQRLNPRACRVVALPAPNDRERTQWYFQRYVTHLPAAGEIVLFDRSWYNRAGVEKVMGFCTADEYEEFFRSVPEFERMLVRSGIRLLKYWFSITDDEQYLRFLGRIHDPLKQWKLSPMDLESRRRWEDYTKAKEVMLERSHIPEAPWWVVQAVDKKRARLNCIASPDPHPPTRNSRTQKPRLPAQARAQPGVPPQPRPARHVRARPLRDARGGSGEIKREAAGAASQTFAGKAGLRIAWRASGGSARSTVRGAKLGDLAKTSNLDLAADLDDLVVRQLREVADARGVAAHRREQRLLPARQALAVLARHDRLVADIDKSRRRDRSRSRVALHSARSAGMSGCSMKP